MAHRAFESGATRNPADHKLRYEGFLCPEVLHRFACYMHAHRHRPDGTLREPDNWQLGIPSDVYLDSLIRHTIDLWRLRRGHHPIDPDTGEASGEADLCCAIMFNVMGYLKNYMEDGQ